jgi:CIC family chloride channel protein
VSHLLTADSIYSLKLRRRGINLEDAPRASVLTTVTVGEVMKPVGPSLAKETTLLEAAAALAFVPAGQLPVVDAAGSYLGIITSRAVAETLADGDHDQSSVLSIVEMIDAVGAEVRLSDALDALESARGAIPVLDPGRTTLVGWLTHQRVLSALRN